MDEKQLEDDAYNGEPPDDAEKCPAPGAPYHDQQKRGVSPGNQKINGRMVKNLQVVFGAFRAEAMIECRGRIQNDQTCAVYAKADYFPAISLHACVHYQDYKSRQT